MTTTPTRVLIVGRSPGVLTAAVTMLNARGYRADATNQYGRVLDDYDVTDLDVLVFGGMVPPDRKEQLRDEISRRNPGVTFVQGLAGVAGVIAAQVEAITWAHTPDADEISYDAATRTVRVTLREATPVVVEALWIVTFTPPEPTSTSELVFDATLAAGTHDLGLPARVPAEASFATVTVGPRVGVFTVGPMPEAIRRLVPTSATDSRLPTVEAVTTHSDPR
ncbi:hypothetical protein I6A60_28000 [Frankia sp. AgB1.9]|uniref:hypothetical protein n=1 Tax=unclassified Frankia TaxID=2632575 RepID=UPI0019342404|nr:MULTISPECIES: hypothetical protein [unclassified Frankia]MBL7493532.1 hypothetical protein [Frankia sp. AgW1.1]MBL7551675.1 hypothetical protein [Frankia sp. AgB1.9]MBL7620211.1 hypothetical protein [Frankia sp. AgB1.8]